MPVIPALGKQRRKDQKFKVTLNYITSSRPDHWYFPKIRHQRDSVKS